MKRLFIGIPLPSNFSEELIRFQKENEFVQGLRWIPVNNLHITLCFIGDYETDRIQFLENNLRDIALTTHSFQMNFEHFQFGPNFNKGYMIWATFQKNENFSRLAKFMEIKILNKKINEPIPHITLSRFKRIEKKDVTLDFSIDILDINVTKFNLYESILKNSGAEYHLINEFILK